VARGPLGKLRDMFSRSSSPSKAAPVPPVKSSAPISNVAVHDLLSKYTGPLWGLMLKEACELCNVAATQGKGAGNDRHRRRWWVTYCNSALAW
jgi:hypothetical protein